MKVVAYSVGTLLFAAAAVLSVMGSLAAPAGYEPVTVVRVAMGSFFAGTISVSWPHRLAIRNKVAKVLRFLFTEEEAAETI